MAATSVVGVYFFAYQLAMQPVLFLSEAIRRVVMPTFGMISDQPNREIRAIRAGANIVGILASFLVLLLAVVIGDIEQLVWRGRWAEAVLPM